ncbi:hypothetical protein WS75_05655 [Burkholderia sp. FL-7-2-10-S1-D7]|nr:hypothetical protein WS75_05655 [Burkholderia sp. FL-7-2-10-S1-D7]
MLRWRRFLSTGVRLGVQPSQAIGPGRIRDRNRFLVYFETDGQPAIVPQARLRTENRQTCFDGGF